MTLRRAAALAAVAALLLAARPTPAVERGPLQSFEVEFLLRQGVSPARVRALVGRLGIAFEPSPDVVEDVRAAGADEALIEVLRAARPTAPTVTTSPAASTRPPQPSPRLSEPEMVQVRGPNGDFWLSRHEITNQQYAEYVRRMGLKPPPAPFWPKAGNLPVVNVTWHDANSYCHWLSLATGRRYRLPTEAEWELAARGGRVGLTYPWGEASPKGRACFGTGAPCPVGSFPANAFGLRDMVGGVAEWCADDREGGKTKAVRGGDWMISLDNGQDVSISRRERLDPDKRRISLGFRVARDP